MRLAVLHAIGFYQQLTEIVDTQKQNNGKTDGSCNNFCFSAVSL